MSDLEKLFTVEDIAQMTLLTSRTIRNYLKDGSLKGRKIGGQWRFTGEDIKNFMDSQTVTKAITDENIQSVYDFIDGTNTDIKGDMQICSIIDLYIDNELVINKRDKIMELLNSVKSEVYTRFYFNSSTYEGETKTRFIIYGSPEFLYNVFEILK